MILENNLHNYETVVLLLGLFCASFLNLLTFLQCGKGYFC